MKKINKKELKRIIQEEIKDLGFFKRILEFRSETRAAPSNNPPSGIGLSRQKDWKLRGENKRKLTNSKLQRIINEEIENVLREIG